MGKTGGPPNSDCVTAVTATGAMAGDGTTLISIGALPNELAPNPAITAAIANMAREKVAPEVRRLGVNKTPEVYTNGETAPPALDK